MQLVNLTLDYLIRDSIKDRTSPNQPNLEKIEGKQIELWSLASA